MQKPVDLDFGEAQAVIAVADALDTGRLNSEAAVTTARAVAVVVYGPSHSRANVLAMGDLLDRLGAYTKGHGAFPHSRSMNALVVGGEDARGPGAGRQANPTRVEVTVWT